MDLLAMEISKNFQVKLMKIKTKVAFNMRKVLKMVMTNKKQIKHK